MTLSFGIHYFNSVIWPRPAPNYVYAAVCISKLASSLEDGVLRALVLTLRNLPLRLAAPHQRGRSVSTYFVCPQLRNAQRRILSATLQTLKVLQFLTSTTPACHMPALTNLKYQNRDGAGEGGKLK
jgi:hypothetical protein